MPPAAEKLAASLEILTALQESGSRVFRSSELPRTHRERLVRQGFLRPVIRGWLISSSPGAAPGDTSPWFASFWDFCAEYCTDRFGDRWHLSAEQSLLLHAESTSIPAQVVIYSPRGTNTTVELLFGTSLYDLKAVIAAMIPTVPLQLVPRAREGFALGCDIQAGGQNLGTFAMLLPSRQRELDTAGPIFAAELDLPKLRKLAVVSSSLEDLPLFPGSSRDLAMEAPASLANAEIERVLASKVKEPLLAGFECFDIFRDPTGEKLSADRKSIAYRLHYRAADRTLKTEEIDAAHKNVVSVLTAALPVSQR